MKTNLAILALLFVTSFSASAQGPTRKDPLLDRLAGTWILQGTIAGQETTHDIESEWVLSHEYLRFHETSREKNAQGQPAYEAIVFIEWDEPSNEYKCLWLDSTAGGVHTTFAYNRATDTWIWLIDNESGGKLTPFARVKLTRK